MKIIFFDYEKVYYFIDGGGVCPIIKCSEKGVGYAAFAT